MENDEFIIVRFMCNKHKMSDTNIECDPKLSTERETDVPPVSICPFATLQDSMHSSSGARRSSDHSVVESASSPFGAAMGFETVHLLQTMLDGSIDAAAITDEVGRLLVVNSALLDLFVYRRWELIGKNVKLLMPERLAARHDEAMQRYVQTGVCHVIGETTTWMSGRRKDGSVFPLTLKVTETWNGQQRLFLGVMRDHSNERQLEHCKDLVGRMLPPDIVSRLLAHRERDSDKSFRILAATHECTAGFIDLVGFTSATVNMAPRRVVSMLSEIFDEFDAACVAFDVEPVKTIGDCYMFVSQRTSRMTAHAANGILFALRCVEIMRARKRSGIKHQFSIRVGIATGPITSGVVSSGRLAFDTWGSTINLAARLETLAPTDGVLVSEETCNQSRYCRSLRFEGPLSNLTAKGFGEVKAYVVSDNHLQPNSCCSTKKRRCLIIDGDGVGEQSRSITVLRHFLSSVGVESLCKYHVEEDCELALWDAILVCVRPPDSSGIETCKRIRSLHRAARIGLLIPEGFWSEELCSVYARQGVGNDECFPLPVDNEDLFAWLQEVCVDDSRDSESEKSNLQEKFETSAVVATTSEGSKEGSMNEEENEEESETSETKSALDTDEEEEEEKEDEEEEYRDEENQKANENRRKICRRNEFASTSESIY